jgi:hypothetical protein
MSHNALVETIAAAILDGMSVTFTPLPGDSTTSATRIRIGVRHERHGRVYENTCEVGLGELAVSDAADTMLADAVADTCRPGV